MLTSEEIAELAKDLESFRVERKESFTSVKSKIEEAICAFANDLPGSAKPGILLLGVADDGTPTGLPIDDALLLNVSGIRREGNILPFPSLQAYQAELNGKGIVVVEVQPSADPPVRLRGRVCVRVGPRRDTATRDEERILTEKRRGWNGPYDQRPIPGSTLADLDLDLFQREFLPSSVTPEVLRENGRSVPEQLGSRSTARAASSDAPT